MLSQHEIPDAILAAENGLHGDIEVWMQAYEDGVFYEDWKALEARNAVSDEAKVKAFVQSSNHLSMASNFIPR